MTYIIGFDAGSNDYPKLMMITGEIQSDGILKILEVDTAYKEGEDK